MTGSLRVVVASDDSAFVRLAAVALTRSGQSVRTVRLGATRLARLLMGGMADVVIVDDDDVLEQVRAVISAGALPIGIVRVHEEGELGVTKWGPLAALVAEVEIAADEVASAKQAPHLRIVS